MAQTRKFRDGTIGVANTIYLKKKTDAKAAKVAKQRTHAECKTVSKSAVLVGVIEKHL